MADKKISALTAATTPLAGTEVLPIVQSGSTVKVSNNDLRPKQIQSNATSGVLQVVGPAAAATRVMTVPDANFTAARTDTAQSFTGDQTLSTGNLIQGTAAKGVTTGGSFSLGLGTNGSTSQVTIDTSGNVLINTSSVNAKLNVETSGNAVTGYFKNDTSGYQTVTVQNAGASGTRYLEWFIAGTTDVGYISSDGTNTSYISLSDYRLKDNIAPMSGALEKLAKLTPRTFTWKSNGKAGQGFIAHELQAVFPEAVTGNKDETDENGKAIYQGVDTSFLVATLVAAVQELQAEIAALKGK